jgi:hypothetical protein
VTTSRSRGARAVRRSLDVLSVALLVAGAGATAVIVVALARGHHPRVDLPVDVGVRAGGPAARTAAGPATVLSTAERLSVVAPTSVTLAVLAFALGVLGLVLLIVRQVRALAADAAAGAPFGERSPQRIRVIGIAIVGAELARGLAGLASAVWVRRHVAQPGISVRLGFPLDIWVLGAGLLVVLLAEVFRMGAALQRDHDLTI